MPRGPFISLDGVDGAGKTTHTALLAGWLRERGCDVVLCRDPGGTPLGEEIRRILLEGDRSLDRRAEMLLYMASRAQLVAEVIEPALAAGRVVLADRYLLANVVYQGHAGGLDVEQLWEVGRIATNAVMPDVTLVLDLDAAEALRRKDGPPDRMERNTRDFHERVRQGFRAEAARNPETIRVIDAARPLDDVQADIRREVQEVFKRRSE